MPGPNERAGATPRLVMGLLVVMLLIASPCVARSATGRPLRSVEGRRTPAGWTVALRFDRPLRYMGRSPEGATTIARVELRAFGLGQADDAPVVEGDVDLPFDAMSGPPIESMTLVAGAGAGEETLFVEIRFLRSTAFEVKQAADLQTLEITIADAAAIGAPQYEAAAASLMQTAKQAMGAGDYARAAQVYTRVLSMNAPGAHSEALEMLGLARERGGQRAHAKAEYERFLEQYPDDPRAPRVRQRLQALSTATATPQAPLSPARSQGSGPRIDLHGSLLSYYSRAQGFLGDGIGSQLYDSSWFTDFAGFARMRTDGIEAEASAGGRVRLDFGDGDVGNDSRLDDLLIEVAQRGRGWWGNVGRQRGDGGVIGRFDGARLGYRASDRFEVQVLGGFPLATYSSDSINFDRYQVGGAALLLDVASLFDVEVYGNYQNQADLTYRGAIGTEIRHLRSGRTLVGSLDYDVFFNAVNLASLMANEQITDALSLNGVIEFRKSPIVTMGNALIGQPVDSLADLETLFDDDEIKQLAKDRSANMARFSAGAVYDLNERLELRGTFIASSLGGTTASAGVPALPSTGYEFGYHAQVGLRDWLVERDSTVFALRVFQGTFLDRYTLEAAGRYPVWRSLRLNPIVRIDYQHGSSDYVQLVPRLRADYAWRHFDFDLDFAVNWTRGLRSDFRPSEWGYSFAVGLRYAF